MRLRNQPITGLTVTRASRVAHNLEHSIANAVLPNIRLVGVCPAEGPELGRLVRRADVIVCSTAAAERVRALAGSTAQVMIDDRALDRRAIEMLAALLGARRRRQTDDCSGPKAARAWAVRRRQIAKRREACDGAEVMRPSCNQKKETAS